MFEDHSQTIYSILQATGEITPAALQGAVEEHRGTGRPLADIVLEWELIHRARLLAAVAGHFGWAHCEDIPAAIDSEVVGLLTPAQAHTYGVVPLRFDAGHVDLLAIDPFNSQVVTELSFALGREVRLVVGDPDAIARLLKYHYGEESVSSAEAWEEVEETMKASPADELSVTELEVLAGQASVVRFVNLVLAQAIRAKASDIHFEPFEHEFKIRYRIDGALYEMTPPGKPLALPITSRLKVLANLNIAERRVPQDGRIRITLAGRPVDLRVSTLPTQFGESVVLRVLDQGSVQLATDQLGLPDAVRQEFESIIRRPNGIILVTGPTGSGKTTTLYSGLRAINSAESKLLTAEDPVEYEIEGIMQVPVDSGIGLTFSAVLRSFLRQDPDIIMVGEIRDLETAQMAIQASLTGHLVLTTLHTNDAAGAVTRLIDMGVEPFLLASTVEAVLAQRLVRRVCRHCRAAYVPTPEQLSRWGLDESREGGREFFRGVGCAHCNQTGYFGRMGLFEWLRLSEPVRELVGKGAPTLAIRQHAMTHGMRTLRAEGMEAARAGLTTLEEVMKYT